MTAVEMFPENTDAFLFLFFFFHISVLDVVFLALFNWHIHCFHWTFVGKDSTISQPKGVSKFISLAEPALKFLAFLTLKAGMGSGFGIKWYSH